MWHRKDTSETLRKLDIQNGGEVKSHVTTQIKRNGLI